MDTQNTDLPKPATSAKAIAAATPPAPAAKPLKRPRKRKRERPMSPSTAKAIELVAKRAGDEARLDIFARFHLTVSGTNRRKILTHPACPPEEDIRTYITNELAHMLDE